jgi:hypothetical protein
MVIPSKPLIHSKWLMTRWRKRELAAAIALLECITAINAYLAEAMMDCPPMPATVKNPNPQYFCDCVTMVAELAREYGWSCDAILDMPLKAIFGFQREISSRKSPDRPMFNPFSNIVIRDYMLQKRN